MTIRHLLFASLSCIAAGLAYCAAAITYPLELAREHWPAYIAAPLESIALDNAVAEIEATPSPLARFLAFAQRALLHARYTAGHFDTADTFATS